MTRRRAATPAAPARGRRMRVVGGLALALLALAPLAPRAARAQSIPASVDEVKAAYLYKFASFVEWPDGAFASADAPIVFGVVGAEAVYAELVRLLAGRTAQGRPLAARRVAPGDLLDGLHVLFIGTGVAPPAAWLQRAQNRPLLVVTDRTLGLDAGAALNFVLAQDRLRFEASLPAIDRSGLRVSSRLLALAQRVVATP